MNLAEKCIWSAYLFCLKEKYKISEKVFRKLVELYVG